MKIYLTQNINRNEPEIIFIFNFIHVKAKTDGSQTIIITEEEISNINLIEKTFEEAQSILNNWIDEENQPPLPLDIDGSEIRQSYINLGIFFD